MDRLNSPRGMETLRDLIGSSAASVPLLALSTTFLPYIQITSVSFLEQRTVKTWFLESAESSSSKLNSACLFPSQKRSYYFQSPTKWPFCHSQAQLISYPLLVFLLRDIQPLLELFSTIREAIFRLLSAVQSLLVLQVWTTFALILVSTFWGVPPSFLIVDDSYLC